MGEPVVARRAPRIVTSATSAQPFPKHGADGQSLLGETSPATSATGGASSLVFCALGVASTGAAAPTARSAIESSGPGAVMSFRTGDLYRGRLVTSETGFYSGGLAPSAGVVATGSSTCGRIALMGGEVGATAMTGAVDCAGSSSGKAARLGMGY